MNREASTQREAIVDLVANIAVPTVVLVFLSGEGWLGPVWGLVAALAAPLMHAAWSVKAAGAISPLTVVAVVSVLLTGGIGLLELDVRWFAWKEAALPLLLGAAMAASWWTPWPVIQILMERLLDQAAVQAALAAQGTASRYRQRLARTNLLLAAATAGSAVPTWGLARWIVTSPTGTPAFNAELGRFITLSLPLIGLPVSAVMLAALWRLMQGLEKDTDRALDDLLIV